MGAHSAHYSRVGTVWQVYCLTSVCERASDEAAALQCNVAPESIEDVVSYLTVSNAGGGEDLAKLALQALADRTGFGATSQLGKAVDRLPLASGNVLGQCCSIGFDEGLCAVRAALRVGAIAGARGNAKCLASRRAVNRCH